MEEKEEDKEGLFEKAKEKKEREPERWRFPNLMGGKGQGQPQEEKKCRQKEELLKGSSSLVK